MILFYKIKTEILYRQISISADHEHMNDLKHAIHVKEVAEAPAHEQHVLELHRYSHIHVPAA